MTMTTYPIREFTAVNVTLRGDETTPTKRLFVDHEGNAYVAKHTGEVHHMQLDAEHAGELVDAMTGVAHGTTAAGAPVAGTHDLELTWGGNTVHVHGAALAADEALHGAIDVAHRVADKVLAHGTKMELHAVPTDEVVGLTPPLDPNTPHIMTTPGNGGIVPPWLEGDEVVGLTPPLNPDEPHIMDEATGGNGGVVPPWLEGELGAGGKNPGIVPPWLNTPEANGGKNPGIVPPWLQ